jgi:hypothetical protein
MEKPFYAILLELGQSKIDVIKWKMVEKYNKIKLKEEDTQELE